MRGISRLELRKQEKKILLSDTTDQAWQVGPWGTITLKSSQRRGSPITYYIRLATELFEYPLPCRMGSDQREHVSWILAIGSLRTVRQMWLHISS